MLENIPAAVGRALSGVRPGLEKLTYANETLGAPETIALSSDAFSEGKPIPARHTADGAKVSPPLRFTQIPAEARSLVLVVEDADSPTPTPLCHALAWNIAAEEPCGFQEGALNADAMPTARCGAVFGKNSFLSSGWLPPDPPAGHGPHRYAFQVYALKRSIDLSEGTGRRALVEALSGKVLARGMLVGTYERAG